jgi:hypothetical protein
LPFPITRDYSNVAQFRRFSTLTLQLCPLENRHRNNGITPKGSKPVMKEKAQHKINLIEDADASGELAKVYDEWRAHSGRQQMPGILKCFSHRPDFLRQVMAFSNGVHFSQGHLDRKTKEAIASYVSYLNRCPY